MTTFSDDFPLVSFILDNSFQIYRLTPNTGNSFKYVDFIADCLPFLSENSKVFADNVNFHC